MIRPVSCVWLVVGAALTAAAGSDTPAPRPRSEAAPLKGQAPAQEPPPRAKQDRTKGDRNEPVEEGNVTLGQPVRIKYSYPLKGDEERRRSVKGLQQLTVDLLALHNMYKEAHWDLTGPLYLPLREYYRQQADFYLQQADTFAERVLHLGASVDGRYSTVARTTKLAELPAGYLTDDHSVKLLLDRVTVLQKEAYQLIGETVQSDPPTSNKLQDLGYAVDKDLWKLRAHLQRPSSRRGDLPWSRYQAADLSGQ